MTTQTTLPGSESSSTFLTTTNFDTMGGGWLGYVSITANSSGKTSPAAVTGLSVTVSPNSSRRLLIIAQANLNSTLTNDYAQLQIVDTTSGATVVQKAFIGFMGEAVTPTENNVVAMAVVTPSGTPTYSVYIGHAGSSAGTINIQADATQPAFLLVLDIGPA